jgi:hypothetical protein
MSAADSGQYRKITAKELLFFVFLLVVCVVGSVGIFWFAVGVESGNRIIKGFMQSLMGNAVGIVAVLLVFNILLVVYYSKVLKGRKDKA